jgi:Protein of unknown function (DUF3311)
MTLSAKAKPTRCDREASSLALTTKRPSTGVENFDRRSGRHQVSGAADGAFADPGGTMRFFLLLVPCVLALWVPLYNSLPPVLFGIPFFYWFQLVLVPLSALAILAADRVSKH